MAYNDNLKDKLINYEDLNRFLINLPDVEAQYKLINRPSTSSTSYQWTKIATVPLNANYGQAVYEFSIIGNGCDYNGGAISARLSGFARAVPSTSTSGDCYNLDYLSLTQSFQSNCKIKLIVPRKTLSIATFEIWLGFKKLTGSTFDPAFGLYIEHKRGNLIEPISSNTWQTTEPTGVYSSEANLPYYPTM